MSPKKTFDDWVADVDPKLRPLARGLRRMFLDAVPYLRESIKWGNPFLEKKGKVFYIASQGDKYVTLGLCQGALLPNFDGLIEGTGKRMRHVKVRSVGEMADNRLGSIIRGAVEVDGGGWGVRRRGWIHARGALAAGSGAAMTGGVESGNHEGLALRGHPRSTLRLRSGLAAPPRDGFRLGGRNDG